MAHLSLARTLAKRSTTELAELYALWHADSTPPVARAELLAALIERMSTPMAAVMPKRRSISVPETASEPKPTAVVSEVRKHATAILARVWRAACSGDAR